MKKWAVTGFYGQDNFGDDLFCYVMAKLMKSHGQDYFLQNGFIASRAAVNVSALPFAQKFNKQRGKLGAVHRLLSMVVSLVRADYLVFGGGSLFGKYASYKQRKFACLLAKILNKKLFAYCVSLGPFKDAEQELRYSILLKKFDLVVTRDLASHQISERMTINRHDAIDMVFAISSFHKKGAPRSRKLVLALHKLNFLEKFLEEGAWLDKFDQILILHLDDQARNIGVELHRRLSISFKGDLSMRHYKDMALEDALDEISSASFVVTSKLHGAIAAAAYGVPFSLLEYQEKCTEFLIALGGFDGYLNLGDEDLFIERTPYLYQHLDMASWELQKKNDLVHQSFKAMINAGF